MPLKPEPPAPPVSPPTDIQNRRDNLAQSALRSRPSCGADDARGAGDRPAQPPQRGHHLRRRRGGRPAVDRHGAAAHPQPEHGAPRGRAAAAAPGRHDRARDARRARDRAPGGRGPPGREAGQRPADRRGPGRAHRLRHRHDGRRPRAHLDRRRARLPAYMSPEQARGKRPGAVADLWSLGATLYAAVEGRPPFDADNALATLTAVISDPVPTPRVEGPLREAILGLLTKDPDQRIDIPTARALLTQGGRRPLDRADRSARRSGGRTRPGRTHRGAPRRRCRPPHLRPRRGRRRARPTRASTPPSAGDRAPCWPPSSSRCC